MNETKDVKISATTIVELLTKINNNIIINNEKLDVLITKSIISHGKSLGIQPKSQQYEYNNPLLNEALREPMWTPSDTLNNNINYKQKPVNNVLDNPAIQEPKWGAYEE